MVTLGIDLGGTSIKAGLVDENGSILIKDKVRTLSNPMDIIHDTVNLCLRICREAGVDPSSLGSIGFGSPGFIDPEKGTIRYSANLHLRDFPLRDMFCREYPHKGIRVYLENDANCAAIAESTVGAARGYRSSVTITLGTGVGAGFVLDGRVFTGCYDMAPEIGHMVIDLRGIPCSCGRRGCMEKYISATALKQQTRDAAEKHPDSLLARMCREEGVSGKSSFIAAQQGDAVGQGVVDTYIEYIAISLTNIIFAYGPEIIVLGGGVCNEGDTLILPLREAFSHALMANCGGSVELALATFKNTAGIIGSSMLHRVYASQYCGIVQGGV